ncbi:hypothetical protein [Aquibacillus sediminis]|nr:hypothetical protein [Aquibacillus sediminis]
MEHNRYSNQDVKTGEQVINEQIMESYHSGVIDQDVKNSQAKRK